MKIYLSSTINSVATCYADGVAISYSNGLTVNVGDTVTISAVAKDGKYFDTVPYITMGGNTYEMTAISDTEYSIDFTVPNTTSSGSIMGTAASYFYFKSEISFATTNIDVNTPYKVGDIVDVIVTADSGYYFESSPYIGGWGSGGDYVKLTLVSSETGEYKSTFTGVYTVPNATYATIYATAQVTPKLDKYGIITVYNPTPQELKEIGDVRYMVMAGDGSAVVDLGAYISSLIKVFVNLPECNKANVVLGGYDTEVQANVLLDDIVETNCGTIEITGKYNNIMDYKNTTIEIYLPFIGFQKLDTDKVMNEVLSLIYKTNIINGDSIACIYNTTGTLLYTFNCNVAFEIPYKTSAIYDDRSDLKIDSNYLFGFTPFVTIRTNKEYNTALVTANDNRVATIKDLSGFITCSQVFNTIKATTQEKEEIDRLLQNGIIV